MKTAWLVVAAAALLPVMLAGQKLELKLDGIAAKAAEKSEIDLDSATLQVGQKMAGSAVPREWQGLLSGMKEVHIRNYEFAKPGEYTDADLDSIRKQVAADAGWMRILNVKEKNESTEIYLYRQESDIGGFLLVAAEARELSVIHVVGTLTMERLTEVVKSSVHYDLAALMAGGKK